MANTNQIPLRFIQPIGRLRLPENMGDGESFLPLYFLTNDKRRISELIDPDIIASMGWTFRDTALEGVIYLEGNIAEPDHSGSALNMYDLVWECRIFLLALWIVKDHAIELQPAILKMSPPDKAPLHLINTSSGHQNFNATGAITPVEFSREEIRIAGEYLQDYIRKLPGRSAIESTPNNDTFPKTNFHKNSTRLLRFMRFLDYARTIDDIGIKLALFCSCLECLFSKETDTQDVTLRVAQRTALFLETMPCQRKAIFKEVKDAYDLRSSVLHGGTIKKKLTRLEQVCIQTDSILRRVFATILRAKSSKPDFFKLFTTDEEQLQECLDDLVFCTRPYSRVEDNIS